MLKLFLVAAFVAFAGFVIVANAQFVVAPDRIAVVVRGGEPVRVGEPGLRWRLPLIEEVAFFSPTRLHRQQTDFTVLLADGSDCRVSATIETRVADPIRAYRWRTSRGLQGSDADVPEAGSQYTAWSAALTTALRDAARTMTPDAAAVGAIRNWISKFSPGTLDDGTNIVGANLDAATCWAPEADKPIASVSDRAAETFGGLKRFVRSIPRPAASDRVPSESIEVRSDVAIDRTGRRVQIEGLVADVRLLDSARAEALFGAGPVGIRNAASRAETHIAAELRRTISELDASGLQAFDPYIIVQPGSPLATRFASEGLAVDDLGGDMMGYRLAQPSPGATLD
jgi:hypothetical protein